MNTEMYQDCLKKHLNSSMQMAGCTVFMQDGAPCHTSNRMKEWFSARKIKVLPWVGQSCDLNPIENLWTELKRIVGRLPPAGSIPELILRIKQGWRILSTKTEYLQKLTDSMVSRCQAVLSANGDVTKY